MTHLKRLARKPFILILALIILFVAGCDVLPDLSGESVTPFTPELVEQSGPPEQGKLCGEDQIFLPGNYCMLLTQWSPVFDGCPLSERIVYTVVRPDDVSPGFATNQYTANPAEGGMQYQIECKEMEQVVNYNQYLPKQGSADNQ